MSGDGARRMGMHATHGVTPAEHVLGDGPWLARLRHRMNYALVRFVPPDRLEADGCGRYLLLFQTHGAKATGGGAIP
jgi:hypothetical protein